MIPAGLIPGTPRLVAQVIHETRCLARVFKLGKGPWQTPLAPNHATEAALIEKTRLTLDTTVAMLKERKGGPRSHQGKTP